MGPGVNVYKVCGPPYGTCTRSQFLRDEKEREKRTEVEGRALCAPLEKPICAGCRMGVKIVGNLEVDLNSLFFEFKSWELQYETGERTSPSLNLLALEKQCSSIWTDEDLENNW